MIAAERLPELVAQCAYLRLSACAGVMSFVGGNRPDVRIVTEFRKRHPATFPTSARKFCTDAEPERLCI